MLKVNLKHAMFVCLLFVIFTHFLGSQLTGQVSGKETVVEFLKNLKDEDFNRSRMKLVQSERSEASFNEENIKVGGVRLEYEAFFSKNTVFDVGKFKKFPTDSGKVEVVVERQGKTQSIPFILKREEKSWKISIKETVSQIIKKQAEIKKRKIGKNNSWNLHKKYTERLTRISGVELTKKMSFFCVVKESKNSFSFIVKDIETGQVISKKTFNNHSLNDMSLSNSGRHLAISTSRITNDKKSATLYLFHTGTWEKIHRIKRSSHIGKLEFSRKGNYLMFQLGNDVAVWDIETKTIKHILRSPKEVANYPMSDLIVKSAEPILFMLYRHQDTRVEKSRIVSWNYRKGDLEQVSAKIDYPLHNGDVNHTGTRLAASARSSIVILGASSVEVRDVATNNKTYISKTLFLTDKTLIYSDYTSIPKVFNIKSGKETYLDQGSWRVRDMDISEDGSLLIASERSGTVKIWKRKE